MKRIIITLLLISTLVIWGGYRVVANIIFTQNCGGYLKRAADANTAELAKKELSSAINYIEKKNLTSGYTSIIYKTPDEDIGFWYMNLKSSLSELQSITPQTSQLEKSNILLKLRQTLLDISDNNEKVTVPDGISIYPHNGLVCFIGVITGLLALIGVFIFMSEE